MTEEKSAQAIWDELDAEETAAPAPADTEAPAPEPVGRGEVEVEETEKEPEEKPEQAALSDEDRALLKQIPEIVQLVKSTVGRVGTLQSELQKIGNAAAKGAGEQPSERQIAKAAASPEKWAALKNDFPDWAEGVEAFVASQIPSSSSIDLDKEVGARVAAAIEPITKARQEDAMDMVESVEPHWQKIRDSKEFDEWLRTKPAEYQEVALTTWKASKVLAVLRDFKSEAAPKPAPTKPAKKLASAAIPRGTQKVDLTKPIDEMTPEEYWAYLDEKEAPR